MRILKAKVTKIGNNFSKNIIKLKVNKNKKKSAKFIIKKIL